MYDSSGVRTCVGYMFGSFNIYTSINARPETYTILNYHFENDASSLVCCTAPSSLCIVIIYKAVYMPMIYVTKL